MHHYGATPEFVLLGGLVPELLCSRSGIRHAGTTDVDVQVDLEIAAGAVNTTRLEHALVNAEFEADPSRVWRWQTEADGYNAVVKFELLADLDGEPTGAVVHFDECDVLGAVNVRGTGFAARDYSSLTLRSRIGGVDYEVGVNVTGIAGFLIAKAAAARSRRAEKDRYDIAFVLLHNDFGGPEYAARDKRALRRGSGRVDADRSRRPSRELRFAGRPGATGLRVPDDRGPSRDR